MPRFKLIVMPDGKLVLTTEDRLDPADQAKVRDLWDRADPARSELVVLPDTEVIVVRR